MASPNTVRLGILQASCAADREANIKKAIAGIERLAKRGAELVCLQELFAGPYFCQKEDAKNFDLAETVPGPTTEVLREAARKHDVAIVASLFEKRAPGLYHNTAAVIDAGGAYLGKYRKMHIPDDPLYYEKFYFAPGDLGYPVFQTRHAKVGVLVCWDQWYPEAARLAALNGAELIVYPTAIGWHPDEETSLGPKQYAAWKAIQTGHAVANGVFVAAVNRVGTEGGLKFWGGSFVTDPFGETLWQGAHDKEDEAVVECNLARVEETRRGWPFLRDRRVDSYEGLLKRFGGS